MTTDQKKFDSKRYLSTHNFTDRMSVLTQMKKDGTKIPSSLSEDLILLGISNDEKQAILEVTGAADNKVLEHFLTTSLADWDQDLAATAIRVWSRETDHLYWSRLYELGRSAHTPQRVLYTIVDLAAHTGGLSVVKSAAEYEALNEMSDALKGLVLHRSVQWNLKSEALLTLAKGVIGDLEFHLHPDNKALPSAIAYLARYEPEALRKIHRSGIATETWKDFIRAICNDLDNSAGTAARIVKQIGATKKPSRAAVTSDWIPVWSRHLLNQQQVTNILTNYFSEDGTETQYPRSPFMAGSWETFGGIDEKILSAAVLAIENEQYFCRAMSSLQGLLRNPTPENIRDQLRSRIGSSKNPADFLKQIPLRLRLELTENPSAKITTPFSRIDAEQTLILSGKTPKTRSSFYDYDTSDADWTCPEDKLAFHQRREFFNVAFRGKKPTKTEAKDYFSLLAHAWHQADEKNLGQIAQVARQEEGVMRLCYLDTLGRFKGMDQAALKTLDFIRSKEQDEMRAIITSLAGVGTPRATQELVSCLTRPNVSPQLQMEICTLISSRDLSNLQKELRSALSDLNVVPNVDTDDWDIRDGITALLTPSEAAIPTSVAQTSDISAAVSDGDLDHTLGGLIPGYKELSSEVKRALRTSLFFHQQVSTDHAPTSIDLSPVIDMQYKAMELLFREAFEDHCSKIIHKGVLQRKLDIIGYARPIPRAMDDFENYIASLPTIRDIPFFSKFKLRKMLRAICQFRPGRRFTLDGLKAFALFFLCFGRSECRYGLAGLFETPYGSDAELYDFCKTLHIFQDFRNRAAHEGFHPDASNDIDGIWRHTAEIVQSMWKLSQHHDTLIVNAYNTPVSRSVPVIEKKVS